MTIKQKMKDIDIGITELSQFLDISRPTVYKFIELYDKREYRKIDKTILKLFNYIHKNELIGKNNVINYILRNIVEIRENEQKENIIIRKINKFLKYNETSQKTYFMGYISDNNKFDEIISFLIEISKIGKKKKKTNLEKIKLKLFNDFENKINNLKGQGNE